MVRKKITRPELDRYLSAMAKRDPSFFSKPKSGKCSDDSMVILKQHRDSISELQIKTKQFESDFVVINSFCELAFDKASENEKSISGIDDDITSLWSELQAVNAHLRQQAEIEAMSKRGLWNKIKSIFRGDKNGR